MNIKNVSQICGSKYNANSLFKIQYLYYYYCFPSSLGHEGKNILENILQNYKTKKQLIIC